MTDTPPDLDPKFAKVKSYYDALLAIHGPRPNSVDWNAHTVEGRFSELCRVFSTDLDEPVSINDFGCGYGALLMHLDATGVPIATYNGYDISESMLDTLRDQYPDDARVKTHHSPQLNTPADYSLASGTFNVQLEADMDEWDAFIMASLDQMDLHSSKGFAFNMLSTYVDWMDDGLYYGDPKRFFDICKTKYSRRVSLFHDSLPYEWTIAVWKEPAP